MLDCLLIADDLTGACDAAVHFARRGRRTVVPLAFDSEIPDADVVAVSTESRGMAGEDLSRLMAEVARRLPVRDARILYKKIDSTLRGDVAGEIAAAVEAFECDSAVITPAFPAVGRIVEAGWLKVAGDPDFAPVPVAPLGVPCRVTHLIPAEARCDRDLDRIVSEAWSLPGRVLWAGSGGLAAALARTLAPARVLFCLGSPHPATLAQEALLMAERPEHLVLRIVGQVPELPDAAALVLSGGDTASLVCRSLGVRRIDLHDEILPGIPRGVLVGGRFDGMQVATKSGGFGAPDALVRVADYFTGRKP